MCLVVLKWGKTPQPSLSADQACMTLLYYCSPCPSLLLPLSPALTVSQRKRDVRHHVSDAVVLGVFSGALGGQKGQLSVY